MYTATNKGILHFRILHTEPQTGKSFMQFRFNQRRWDEALKREEWMGPWINTLPELKTGLNEIVIMIEVETFQVSFNGVHIDLEESMPVYVQDLRDVVQIFMQLQDNHMAFKNGTTILTPMNALGMVTPSLML